MEKHCLFCCDEELKIIDENSLSYAIRDIKPVTDLHTLIVTKRHCRTILDLSGEEFSSILALAKLCYQDIKVRDPSVKGFNFGSNNGSIAGQKIGHVHFHLIPRRRGDIPPPPAR